MEFYRTLFNWLERHNRYAVRVLRLLERTFTACTPAFAAPYQIAESGKLFTPLSAAIFGAALAQCLLLSAAMSSLSGTFPAVKGCSVEFAEDWWNIGLYLVVCPAYVTLCVRLVLLSMERDPQNLHPLTNTTSGQTRRVFVCLFLACVFSSVLITNYVDDALNPKVVEPAYWFVDSTAGVRRLNAAGLYYIVLNFALLFITFLGGAAFIGVSIDGIRLAGELLDSGTPIDFDIYALRVRRLLVAYFFGTLLIACYAINMLIWQHSPLGTTANIHIAAAILTVLGIFFVAVPKQFIDHVWARYVERRDAAAGQRGVQPSGVPLPHQCWATVIVVANFAWIGTWVTTYYDIEDYLEASYWLREVLTQQPQPEQPKQLRPRFGDCGKLT